MHVELKGPPSVRVDGNARGVGEALKEFFFEQGTGQRLYDAENEAYEAWRACGQSKLANVLEYVTKCAPRASVALFLPPVVLRDDAALAAILEELVERQLRVQLTLLAFCFSHRALL